MAWFGANVAIGDVDEEGERDTAELVQKIGQKSLAVRADVSHPGDVQHMVKETVEELGAIASTMPMGRRGVPAELRGMVSYPASDASSFVTGQVFISDGGICI